MLEGGIVDPKLTTHFPGCYLLGEAFGRQSGDLLPLYIREMVISTFWHNEISLCNGKFKVIASNSPVGVWPKPSSVGPYSSEPMGLSIYRTKYKLTVCCQVVILQILLQLI
jgi:hypothetical protein